MLYQEHCTIEKKILITFSFKIIHYESGGESLLQKLHFPAAATAGLCSEGGGKHWSRGGGRGDTGTVGVGWVPADSWASLSSCVQNVSVARV